MYLYEITNTHNNKVYVGITRNSIARRWASHRHSAKIKTKTPLYCAMHKYGVDSFTITEVREFEDTLLLQAAEKELVSFYRQQGRCYNVLDGGASYFPIKDMEAHKANLRKARAGRKPALGMKHTEENKKLFSECSKMRWDIYGRYPKHVITLSFKEANKQYGISKTHFYRLLKLARSNESS